MQDVASTAAQNYLKGMFQLEIEDGLRPPLPTNAVAQRLGVSAASATNMLKKLDSLGLVEHVPYHGVALTEAGRKIALEVIRHHRLLETYLAEALGVPWDEVHAEAEILEHVLSERLEDRISILLGHPTSDPHGHPIPTKDGSMPAASTRTLWTVGDGERVEVERVSDEDADALRYLGDVGIVPGAPVLVVKRGPVGGPLHVLIGDDDEMHALSRDIAEAIWVG